MDLKDYITITEDFPVEGVSFKDISALLASPSALKEALEGLATLARAYKPTLIVGPEARGFVFGAALAYLLGTGFVMARKKGKLPGDLIEIEYELEYGSSALFIPKGLIKEDDRVLIIDDLLATGGTFLALINLVRKAGSEVVGILSVLELTDLHGREKLLGIPFESLVKYRS